MSLKNWRFKVFAFFITTIAFAAIIFIVCEFGFYKMATTDGRTPAAISKEYDYSHLQGGALTLATQERLINGAKVISVGESVGLELGLFSVKNADGRAVMACEIYETVELVFHAGNMAVNGEPPIMTVSGPCEPTQDLRAIAPLMLPYQNVLSQSVRDREFNQFDNTDLKVKFVNVSDSWPRSWVLHSAKLKNSHGDSVEVLFDEIRRIRGQALAVDWQ